MGFYRGPHIVTDGLVLSLDAGNTKSYPGSGTTWYDLSGNGNHGTISNGEFVAEDRYLRNSGNTSNFFTVGIAHSTSINSTLTTTTGGWTIEEVIWTNSVGSPNADGGTVVSEHAYVTGQTGFDWNHGNGLDTIRFGMSSNSTGYYEDEVYISTGAVNALNTWRVRTMIWDRGANQIRLYMNGGYSGAASTPNTAGTAIYDGGGINFGSLYGWRHFGRRAGIKIYNRALSAQEILQNYTATKSRFGL
jgi:hypothetical protein